MTETAEPTRLILAPTRALSPSEEALALAVAEAAYRAGFEAGHRAAFAGSVVVAQELVIEAQREMAAAGPVWAALMQPVTRRVDRDEHGQITQITESRT